jgi:16S rRNA (guanine966-N2)-methyltransferase
MSAHRPPAAAATPGSIRLIGGRWRGSRLPVADVAGLRPTSDRVRETLFNWLQPVLPGACVLDLFAGSGALGLEAVSRGAASAVLVEADAGLAKVLEETASRLDATGQVQVRRMDALTYLEADGPRFDLAFVDPPFAADLWGAVLTRLPARMASASWMYVESPVARMPTPPADWQLHREGQTRDVRYVLYRRVTLGTEQAPEPQTR